MPARISDARRERVRDAGGHRLPPGRLQRPARADFFVDGEDVLLNELNTMPGFTQTSVYGKLWDHSGACPIPSCATAWCGPPSSASS